MSQTTRDQTYTHQIVQWEAVQFNYQMSQELSRKEYTIPLQKIVISGFKNMEMGFKNMEMGFKNMEMRFENMQSTMNNNSTSINNNLTKLIDLNEQILKQNQLIFNQLLPRQNRQYHYPLPDIIGHNFNNRRRQLQSQHQSNLPRMMRQPSFLSNIKVNQFRKENFKIVSELGEGKFGKVFMVQEVHTGFLLAMKIIQKKFVIQQNLLEKLIRELRIQSFLDHPNIVSLYGFFADRTHFFILMEVGCGGSLYQYIQAKKALSQRTTSFIIKNLLLAIQYIHTNKIIHRDIKPENIVLVLGQLKICDFSEAVYLMHPEEFRVTFCGTPLYFSPQMLKGDKYNQKIDIWAIGIISYQLHLGRYPFDIEQQTDLGRIITDHILFPISRQIKPRFKLLIQAMLQKNPNKRPPAKQLLAMTAIQIYFEQQTCSQFDN